MAAAELGAAVGAEGELSALRSGTATASPTAPHLAQGEAGEGAVLSLPPEYAHAHAHVHTHMHTHACEGISKSAQKPGVQSSS